MIFKTVIVWITFQNWLTRGCLYFLFHLQFEKSPSDAPLNLSPVMRNNLFAHWLKFIGRNEATGTKCYKRSRKTYFRFLLFHRKITWRSLSKRVLLRMTQSGLKMTKVRKNKRRAVILHVHVGIPPPGHVAQSKESPIEQGDLRYLHI